LLSPENLIALLTLTLLEIVLGVDNGIFISILADKLPESQRARARRLGLALALVMRILLLLSLAPTFGSPSPSSRFSDRRSLAGT
jgi:predicted tellurium resistance membrane protein TerC